MSRSMLALLVASVACIAPLHATVTVVSPVTSFNLQNAIGAAADGDILLLKPNGSVAQAPPPADIFGKGLTLVADGGDVLLGHVVVQHLAPEQQVVLRGLRLEPTASDGFASGGAKSGVVEVLHCAGPVWIDGCTLIAPPVNFGLEQYGVSGLHTVDSANVVATDCTISGGDGAEGACGFLCTKCCVYPTPGGDGVTAVQSHVALLRCSIRGGVGGGPTAFGGVGTKQPSGSGVLAWGDSVLHLAGCSVDGGPLLFQASAPGPGLSILDSGSWVQLRDTIVHGGAGNPPGMDIDAPAGNFLVLPAPARGLDVTSPVRVDTPGLLHISAQPGDLVMLFEATTGGWLPMLPHQGVLLLGSPFFGPVFVAVDTVGDWTLPFLGPHSLPPGTLGQTALIQLVVKAGPQVLLEDVASFTLLDASVP